MAKKDSGKQKHKRFHPVSALILTLITIVIILVAGYFFTAYSFADSNAFLPGTTINGIEVGNMTIDGAREVLLRDEEERMEYLKLNIMCDTKSMELQPENFVVSDLETVMKKAFDYAKGQTDPIPGMNNILAAYYASETAFQSTISVDEKKLKSDIHAFAQQFYVAPVIPEIQFNSAGNTFSFTKETAGSQIDETELYLRITDQFKKREKKDISVSILPVQPKETSQTLMQIIQSLGASNIEDISDNSVACNSNIELLTSRIHGKVILSGEIFSMHSFLEDNALSDMLQPEQNDQREDSVSQFAGMMYQAALYANMEIVQRNPQPHISKHLDAGMDALIDDRNDLELKNTSDYPMYIRAQKNGDAVKIEILGAKLADGLSIKIEPQTLETIPPPAPQIIPDSSLNPGEKQTVTAPANGYRIKIFRKYYRNSEFDHDVLVSTDVYEPVQGVYRQG